MPSRLADLTPDWLTAALREGSVLNVGDVEAVSATVIGEELGFTGVVARLELTYSVAGGGPRSIVAKLPTAERRIESGFRRRTDAHPQARRRLVKRSQLEIRFYEEIATGGPSPAPRMFFGAADTGAGTAILLLEDLGNVRQPDLLAGMSASDARAVLGAMAPFHAHWWRRAGTSAGWVPAWEPHPQARQDRFDVSVDTFLDRYSEALPADVGYVIQAMRKDYGGALRELAAAPPTLIHGDLHADNIVFADGAEDAPAVVLDWQTVAVGPAVADVNTLLVGSMTTPTRRRHEMELLAEYHELLSAAGVRGLDLAQLVSSYRLASRWHLARTVVWLGNTEPAELAGRERLIVEGLISEPRVFEAALDHAG